MNDKTFRASLAAMIILGLISGFAVYKDLSWRPALKLIRAKKEDIEEVISVSGKIRPINSAELSFEDGGRITYLAHKEGDKVGAGEILAKANDSDLRLLHIQALNFQKSAEATLEENDDLKDKEEEKLRSLKKSKVANHADKEAQKEQIEASENTVKAQEYQVEAAKAYAGYVSYQIEKKNIKAPFSGVIVRQDAEVGEVYGTGTTVLTLVDNSRFKIESYVSQTDAQRLKVGDSGVAILDNDTDRKYTVKISELSAIETVTGDVSSYKVTFEFEGTPEGLLLGTDANIDIKIQKKNEALVLPQSAVFLENNDAYVYVPSGPFDKKQKIKTGIITLDNMVEITSGLKKNDEVYVPD